MAQPFHYQSTSEEWEVEFPEEHPNRVVLFFQDENGTQIRLGFEKEIFLRRFSALVAQIAQDLYPED